MDKMIRKQRGKIDFGRYMKSQPDQEQAVRVYNWGPGDICLQLRRPRDYMSVILSARQAEELIEALKQVVAESGNTASQDVPEPYDRDGYTSGSDGW